MTRLTDLEAEFCRSVPNGLRRVDTFAEAQGIIFLCPGCLKKKGTTVGVHSVLVWFADRGVPADATPVPRWKASGTGLSDLTLHPSIDVTAGGKHPEEWHGWIQNGDAS